jgi:SAM-dependent methyltransferase
MTNRPPADHRLLHDRFPRSNRYHPDWMIANGFGGNALWLTEWLTEAMTLLPGMRVLDLGCGKATSSIFLAREFGVQVWAVDLWVRASDNQRRIADTGLADRIFPLHCDARCLPFAAEFFDAVVCIDCLPYFGTDDLYLNYLASFVKSARQIGIAGAGLVQELPREGVPAHLGEFWTQDCWGLHSADWWRQHWERTGIVEIEVADTMEEGWRVWLDWHLQAHPGNRTEITTLKADQGGYLGYVRTIGRRREGAKLEDYCWPDNLRSFPAEEPQRVPLLRNVGE